MHDRGLPRQNRLVVYVCGAPLLLLHLNELSQKHRHGSHYNLAKPFA